MGDSLLDGKGCGSFAPGKLIALNFRRLANIGSQSLGSFIFFIDRRVNVGFPWGNRQVLDEWTLLCYKRTGV
jgi:hypothetical protein